MSPSASPNRLYTIGHGSLDLDAFINLLVENGVTAVADVRSSPYSRYSPQFNREPLKAALPARRIQYVFLGEELGARRDEQECYIGDVASYDLIAKTGAFNRGLERLRTGLVSRPISLLCAEKDPLTCHRMILICRHFKREAEIVHILAPGECESQAQAESRLLKLIGLPERDLFRSKVELLDEAYERQGAEIAYRRDLLAADAPEGE
jgi:uncharacterized protein (DUF488 family)